MTTLSQFRTAVSGKIGLDNTAGSNDQLAVDIWVNEGVTDVLLRTGCTVSTTTLALTAGTKDYTLDTGILRILSCDTSAGGTSYLMEQVSLPEIRELQALNSTSTSPVQLFAVAGSNLFTVYPTPATADTVNLTYVARPGTLSATSDSASVIPQEFQKAVEYYALSEAGDYDDDSTSNNGATYRQMYEQWIKEIKKAVARKTSPAPRVTVNRRGRMLNRPRHRNDIY